MKLVRFTDAYGDEYVNVDLVTYVRAYGDDKTSIHFGKDESVTVKMGLAAVVAKLLSPGK